MSLLHVEKGGFHMYFGWMYERQYVVYCESKPWVFCKTASGPSMWMR